MTTSTLRREGAEPALQPALGGPYRLLHAEWTKIRSVRSTFWSLVSLVVAAVGLNTLVVGAAIANWGSTDAATKARYTGDPTGFLAAALQFAEIPLVVLGVLVITSEYSTGMIRSSILAVPKRTPMFVAKAAVFGLVIFLVSEALAFASFLIAQRIIGNHVPESLGNPATLRAVFGVGLYLTVLGLFSFAVGAIVRHTAAAITCVIGLVSIASSLGGLPHGSVGKDIDAWVPTNAGLMITHAHQEAGDLLSPWQGFGVLCLCTVALLAAGMYLLNRRDV